jgi:hypothetical protein
MANFSGGVIPTFPITANGAINGLGNSIVQTLGGSVINVALNQVTPEKWRQVLGVGPTAFDNILPSIQRSSLSAGEQLFNQFLTDNLSSSGAGGVLGNIGINLARNAASNVFQNLLGDIAGAAIGGGKSSRWFPGASNEPVANYGLTTFTKGLNGPDVTFSIIPALSGAARESASWLVDPKSKASLNAREAFAETSGGYIAASNFDTAAAFSKEMDLALSLPDFKGKFPLVGSEEFFKYLSGSGGLPLGDLFANSDLSVSLAESLSGGWNFICAPESISWNSEAQVERVPMFGTNQPPVISGSKSMRDLTLSDALVEGFSRGRSVEDKIARLENLMNFTLDTKNKYIKVPVYYVQANNKLYGNGLNGADGGYFVIKSVNVKELMRDLSGSTTRATVDVSFVQVPPYQVTSGRDLANIALIGRTSILPTVADAVSKLLSSNNETARQVAGVQTRASNPNVEGGLNRQNYDTNVPKR